MGDTPYTRGWQLTLSALVVASPFRGLNLNLHPSASRQIPDAKGSHRRSALCRSPAGGIPRDICSAHFACEKMAHGLAGKSPYLTMVPAMNAMNLRFYRMLFSQPCLMTLEAYVTFLWVYVLNIHIPTNSRLTINSI